MKKFTIEVSQASPAQLTTIGLELKIMANSWEKHGPRIKIDGQQVQAPKLRIEGSSSKLQAASTTKQTQLNDIKFYAKERSKRHCWRTKHAGQDALLFYKFTSD